MKECLKSLLKLELIRIRTEKKANTLDDYTIRMCQAEIAGEYFSDRKEWINILKSEYGLKY